MSVTNKKSVFKYEKLVIDPILKMIKKHQEYLTKKENIPQLAKLGFIYNTLWYHGRVAWGHDGRLGDGNSCENNPKYKIEACEPINEKIENLIYDAWAMHVSNDFEETDFKKFTSKIIDGREYSDLEKRSRKPNKTFDEWVEVLTDPEHRYSSIYPDRRSVANHLLCVIGNGYGVNKEGFVISEAGGADQDRDLYGEWENAKFGIPEIQKVVDKILSYKELENTFVSCEEARKEWEKERKKDNLDIDPKSMIKKIKKLLSSREGISDEERNMFEDILGDYEKDLGIKSKKKKRERPYVAYYPISNYSIIHLHNNKERDVNLEPSAVAECINICKEIIGHQDVESEENIAFAKKFLFKNGYDEYANQVPKEIDKYAVLDQFLKNFEPVKEFYPQSKSENYHEIKREGAVSNFYLNDTRDNQYADNCYYGIISLSSEDASKISKGYSNEIECIKTLDAYKSIKDGLENTLSIEEVRAVFVYVENTDSACINIKVEVSEKQDINLYTQDTIDSEKEFTEQGFGIGDNSMCLLMDQLGLVMVTSKALPLGSTHPNNKSGKEYFSNSQPFDVYDSEWNKLGSWSIDERGFNTFSGNKKSDLGKWLHEEHKAMKLSDSNYGTYGVNGDSDRSGQGSRDLYAHDFMLWLKDRQSNFK